MFADDQLVKSSIKMLSFFIRINHNCLNKFRQKTKLQVVLIGEHRFKFHRNLLASQMKKLLSITRFVCWFFFIKKKGRTAQNYQRE